MNRRVPAQVRAMGLFLAAAWLVSAFVPARAQTGAATSRKPAKPWTVSRTPDGQPDLQGFWTNTTYVPLERPKNVTKEFYTKEEVAEKIKTAATAEAEQTEPGTIPDVHYDF